MNEEDLADMLESPHYKVCLQIQEKLEPIVDMIQENLPEVYEKISEIFKDLEE
jgi:hypothetical protein